MHMDFPTYISNGKINIARKYHNLPTNEFEMCNVLCLKKILREEIFVDFSRKENRFRTYEHL